ncbi:MAG: hypothetical protein IPN34_01715 [Planctomycetes bacterium]|nr:hypothetical protein [Planctomycetota bacterium]
MGDPAQGGFSQEELDLFFGDVSPELQALWNEGEDAVAEHRFRKWAEEFFGEAAPDSIPAHLRRLWEDSDPIIQSWRTTFPEEPPPLPHERDIRESARALLRAASSIRLRLRHAQPFVEPEHAELCGEWIREATELLPRLVRSVQVLIERRYFQRFRGRQDLNPFPLCEDAEDPTEPMKQWLSSEIREKPEFCVPLESYEDMIAPLRASHFEGEGAALPNVSRDADAEALPILFEDFTGFVLPGGELRDLDYRQRAFVQALAEDGGGQKKSRVVMRRVKEIERAKAKAQPQQPQQPREKIQADKVWGIRSGERKPHVAIGPLIERTPGPGGGNRDALWRLREHQVRPRS